MPIDDGVKTYAKLSGDDNGVEQYKQMKKEFGPKLAKLWDIVANKFIAGLGNESAFVMDLNGTLPKIPGDEPSERHAR